MNLLSNVARRTKASPIQRPRTIKLALFVAILAISYAALAQSIGYTISLESPELHLAEIQIILPPGASGARTSTSGVERTVPGPRLSPNT